jgi:glycosyltransferase involved in cell wall biosynthesis
MTMRIGVDVTCWSNRRGYGRFARALLTATLALDPENGYVFFVDDDQNDFPLPKDRVEVVHVPVAVPAATAASASGHRSLRDAHAWRRTIHAEKLDLFFFPSVYSYVPLGSRLPQIVTVHDAFSELFPKLVFPSIRARLLWRAKVRIACAQARIVLTVSEYSRRSLEERLKLAPSRLRVVNEASDPVFRRLEQVEDRALWTRLGLSPETRFFTYLGGFSPHKNLGLLVDVFRELHAQPQFADVRLLLIGDYEGDAFYSCYPQLAEQVRRAGLQGRVLFTGYLCDEDVAVLLNLTQALVLPSFCEGFGLPAVEAAACGAPVLATTRSPIVELLGEGALGLEPGEPGTWRDALARIVSDPKRRKAMGEAGLAAAARLSWHNSARQLLSVFAEVLQPCDAPA